MKALHNHKVAQPSKYELTDEREMFLGQFNKRALKPSWEAAYMIGTSRRNRVLRFRG